MIVLGRIIPVCEEMNCDSKRGFCSRIQKHTPQHGCLEIPKFFLESSSVSTEVSEARHILSFKVDILRHY